MSDQQAEGVELSFKSLVEKKEDGVHVVLQSNHRAEDVVYMLFPGEGRVTVCAAMLLSYAKELAGTQGIGDVREREPEPEPEAPKIIV